MLKLIKLAETKKAKSIIQNPLCREAMESYPDIIKGFSNVMNTSAKAKLLPVQAMYFLSDWFISMANKLNKEDHKK